jgi:signal transduction histidine kinase
VNLLENAIDVSFNRSKVEISFLNLYLDDREMIVCTVKDDGLGIPRNRQKDIFKPGFDNCGFGLSLHSKIIEQLGGRIELLSLNYGTLFKFTVPVLRD